MERSRSILDVVARRLLAMNDMPSRIFTRHEAADVVEIPRRTSSRLRAAVERWLQVAIEACIDIATHAVAYEGWTPVDTARAAFASLFAAHGRMCSDLAERLGRAAGSAQRACPWHVVGDDAGSGGGSEIGLELYGPTASDVNEGTVAAEVGRVARGETTHTVNSHGRNQPLQSWDLAAVSDPMSTNETNALFQDIAGLIENRAPRSPDIQRGQRFFLSERSAAHRLTRKDHHELATNLRADAERRARSHQLVDKRGRAGMAGVHLDGGCDQQAGVEKDRISVHRRCRDSPDGGHLRPIRYHRSG